MTDGLGEFGERLRARRVRLRLTQQQVASRAGMSVRAVRYIEQGLVRRPRPESVRRLAEAVGLEGAEMPLPSADEGGSGEPADLRVAVLGPLEVRRDGAPVDIGPAKQRVLLGLLALQSGRVVGREEIIGVLWGDDPPDSCRNLVHTYVTRLRKALGPEGASAAVTRARGGYALSVADGGSLDVARFDVLAARADSLRAQDPATAAGLYGDALDVWRGAVAADLTSRLRQHPAAVAVMRRRAAVASVYADLAVEHGGREQAAERLWRVLEEEPLHEGLHARLMLALAGSGQQAAALRLFEGLRVRLSEELGVSPGQELQEAHLKVLHTVGAVDVSSGAEPDEEPVPVPAQLPAGATAFTGRASELRRLDAELSGAPGDGATTPVALVVGPAGVGKTALAVRWAHHVRARFPDGQLYVDLRGYGPGRPLRPIQALTLFLRSLGVPAARVPTDPDLAAGLYRSLLAERRVLIVLDNCGGVDQARALLPGARGCAVLITSRNRLGGLVAKDGARRVVLDPLPPDEAAALLTEVLGSERARSRDTAELARLCGHLPLAMRISAANLDNDPHRSVADYIAELREGNRLAALQVDGDHQSSVRAAFDLSYLDLAEPTRRLFRLLGLVPGPDLTAEAAAALTGVQEDEARRELAHLSAVHLIQEHAPGRYAFHDLIRLYAAERTRAEDTPDERRTAVNGLYGWYLDMASAAADVLDPGRYEFGGTAGRPPVNAPGTAAEAMAWLEAERADLIAAITELSKHRRHTSVLRLSLTFGAFFFASGYVNDWIAVFGLALQAARKLADRRAEAEVLRQLGLAYWRSGDHRLALKHHRWALAMEQADADPHGEAETLNKIGFALDRTGPVTEALDHQRRALDLSRSAGDRWREGRALIGVANTHRQFGRNEESLGFFREALALTRATGDRWGESMALAGIGCACAGLGLHVEALERLDQAIGLTREISDRASESLAMAGRGLAHLLAGRTPEAMDDFQDALALTRAIGDRWTENLALVGRAFAHLVSGGLTEAENDFERVLAIAGEIGDRWYGSRALVGKGHVRSGLGRHDRAADHYGRALELAREIGNHGVEAEALNGLAQAHHALGDHEQALVHYRHALTTARRIGDRSAAARAGAGIATVNTARMFPSR